MGVSAELATSCLVWAAAYDGRKADSAADQRLRVMAWAEALDTGITPEDARRAITEHYATSTEWLKPAHINRRCAEYRRVRAEKAAQERELRELEDARARAGMAEETKNKLNEILAKIGKKDGE